MFLSLMYALKPELNQDETVYYCNIYGFTVIKPDLNICPATTAKRAKFLFIQMWLTL